MGACVVTMENVQKRCRTVPRTPKDLQWISQEPWEEDMATISGFTSQSASSVAALGARAQPSPGQSGRKGTGDASQWEGRDGWKHCGRGSAREQEACQGEATAWIMGLGRSQRQKRTEAVACQAWAAGSAAVRAGR